MEYLEMTNTVYFRKLVKEGKIVGTKVNHPTMAGIVRWEFSEESLKAYKAKRLPGKGPRTDGRNRAVIHLTDAEFAEIRKQFPNVPLTWQNKGLKKVKKTK